jgi:CBS domain-containing protein
LRRVLRNDGSDDAPIARFETAGDGMRHKSYPVVDGEGRVLAMVSRSDVLRWTRAGSTSADTLGDPPRAADLVVGFPDELVGLVARRAQARAPVIRVDRGARLVAHSPVRWKEAWQSAPRTGPRRGRRH